MYQTILFDLDGTLTDPKEGITKSVQYALKAFGIEVEDLNELLCFIGPPLKESFMNDYGFSEKDAERAIEKYRERFSQVGLFENEVYEGIPHLLQALKAKGKTLAIATSKPEVFTERILEKYELRSYFEKVVGSQLDGSRSRKSEVIEETLRQLKVSGQVIMVGDRKQDILGAKACQLPSIGVKFGYASPNELERAGATYLVETVKELEEFLMSR